MSWLFGGLPLHPLFVHAAVISVPVVALLALAAAWIPKMRNWLGIVLPVLATLAFLATLVTQQSGEALAEQVTRTAAITAHTQIADVAVAGAALLFAGTWVHWAWPRYFTRPRPGRSAALVADPGTARVLSVVIAIALSVVAVFAIVSMIIVGDTGARALWRGAA